MNFFLISFVVIIVKIKPRFPGAVNNDDYSAIWIFEAIISTKYLPLDDELRSAPSMVTFAPAAISLIDSINFVFHTVTVNQLVLDFQPSSVLNLSLTATDNLAIGFSLTVPISIALPVKPVIDTWFVFMMIWFKSLKKLCA